MKVLSLVVPAYNSERFLDKGIGSFLHDAVLDKLDIIIVNDGSMDTTAQLADKYCKAYPQSVRLISQENKGHGGALNTGCSAAVGKYLKVIDADDWIETDNLPEFIRILENCQSDVVLTHYNTIDISTGEVKKWRSYPDTFGKALTMAQIMENWKGFDRALMFHGITYKTEFYHAKGIRLSEHVFYEDHEFATFPCCYAESVTPYDIFVYDYRIGDMTQSVSDTNQLKRIGHTATVLERMIREYQGLTCSEGGKRYVAMKAQGLLLSYLTTALLVAPDKKQGRALASAMKEKFRAELPEAWALAQKKYLVFCLMNRLGVSKKTFQTVLQSKVYNKLRRNHDFK